MGSSRQTACGSTVFSPRCLRRFQGFKFQEHLQFHLRSMGQSRLHSIFARQAWFLLSWVVSWFWQRYNTIPDGQLASFLSCIVKDSCARQSVLYLQRVCSTGVRYHAFCPRGHFICISLLCGPLGDGKRHTRMAGSNVYAALQPKCSVYNAHCSI